MILWKLAGDQILLRSASFPTAEVFQSPSSSSSAIEGETFVGERAKIWTVMDSKLADVV